MADTLSDFEVGAPGEVTERRPGKGSVDRRARNVSLHLPILSQAPRATPPRATPPRAPPPRVPSSHWSINQHKMSRCWTPTRIIIRDLGNTVGTVGAGLRARETTGGP
ncbi:hypothetical protein EYF80_062415 [Liparis tanakae]|uniref:Uncharacterized protein n=1 Tax=Liparis tanakae TaxID=230148 RepID=A0A4Z2EFG5_9TELE|nr:hypothetical protein EYF80_062415 [Liparis tanakae]